MGKINVKVQTPVKAVNRALARSEQPDRSVYNGSNVSPFDRYGRLRVGQRTGTAKLYASTVLGSGAQNVAAMAQTTIALDPATVVADTLNFNEPFTYANGNLGTLNANWFCTIVNSNQFLTVFNGASSVGGIEVNSNTARAGAAVTRGCSARYTGAITLGSAYVIKVTCGPFASAINYCIAARLGAVALSAGNNSINLVLLPCTSGGPGSVTIFANGVSIAAFVIPTNTSNLLNTDAHILELRVNGDSFQGYVDGIQYVAATSSLGSSQTQVGFSMIDASGGGNDGLMDLFQVYTATSVATLRQTNLIACAGGNVYEGNLSSIGVAVGGTAILKADVIPSIATATGKAYFADGFTIRQLNLLTQAIETYAATAGTAPTLCTLACLYRGRLVLAAPRDNLQNFFFSRVGTLTDWDYTQTDAAAAFAGNASLLGRIGEPIVALMPFSDDMLCIGGDHNLWAIRGDPTAGGSIDLVSDAIGVIGPNSWCKDPVGVIYFCGTGGLFKMNPADGGAPTLISYDKYNQFFSSINRGTQYVSMCWDRDNHGCHIFVTPVISGSATHLFYDLRTDSLSPMVYPNSHGPISAIVYDGDAPTDRMLLMGGRTGLIQKLSSTALADDGTAISSSIFLGPFHPRDGDSILTSGTLVFGELAAVDAAATFECTMVIRAGKTAYDVTEGTPKHKAQIVFTRDGRTKTFHHRLRGEWFSIELKNSTLNKYWSFEEGKLEFEEAGLNRTQR
jgi:hypothetical protein